MESSSTDRHDVFISFNTKDTRYSFVSHLSAAFSRRNISLFLGEDCLQEVATPPNTDFQIPDAIQSAIERSSVCVVVFSENYAFSPLCLETLVKFLDLQRLVIPVFYGEVTPLIVEQQTERFGDAFSDHRSFFSKDRVVRWRNGLIKAAKLQGHESTKQRIDSELVEEIVVDVRENLYPTGKIGIYLRLLGIETLLCKQSNDICRLGIWGMPGIGKTTIAEAVFNQMFHEFENRCFVQDFHVKFNKKRIHEFREEHYVEKLREKVVLVVLDDVRNPMEAESFLGGFDCFSPGSLIIITSRDKQVLYQCQVQDIYEVPSLNKKESLQLFTRFAFPKDKPNDGDLVEVSKNVLEYVNGNPAALCFYGRELEGRVDMNEMKDVFEKIKQCPPREIINLFKSSYDVLSENERSIFLDIAYFFNGEQLDYIMPIFEECGFVPHVGIDRLVEMSLLVISKKKKVEIHNLIQDVAREIVNQEKNPTMRARRLWDPSTIISLLEDKEEPKGTEVTEGIFLDTRNLNIVVNPMVFEDMYNLRLLKIHSTSPEAVQELHLPEGLHSLPYELRLLHWEKYPLRSLPQDFEPSHLVELNMPYSQLQSLWGGNKSLPKLKIVNLSHSEQLVEVDELSKAFGLEQIDLQGCTSLESIPETNQLKNLQLLNLSSCTTIKRSEITVKVKGLDLEGGLRETKPESMVFSMVVKLEDEDNTESF